MKTLEEAIERFSGSCMFMTNQKETCEQLSAWLRELAERRKADSCEGCRHNNGKYYICLLCKRHYGDRYVSERRTDG